MENKDKETVGLKSIIVNYLHHWKLFLLVFLLSFIPAILYLTLMPRTYNFMARIQVMAEKETSMASMGLGEAAGLMKSFGIGTGGGSVNIDDEISILSSNRMMRLMALKLGLNVSYSKLFSFRKLYNETPLKLTADTATMLNINDEYTFSVSVSSGNIKVKAKSRFGGYNETFRYQSLPATIKIGSDEFVLSYNDKLPIRESSFKLNIRCFPASWVAEDLCKNIQVNDVSASSNILELSCSDHSLERGKDILNTLISEYNEDDKSYKGAEDNKTMEFVDERVAKVVKDLANVELEIEAYKTRNSMTLLEADVTMYGDEFQSLQKAILEAESQSRLVDMLNEYIKDPKNKYNVVPSIMTVAEGEKGGAISQYNEAIIERDRILNNSNEQNPMFKIINNQVDKLRNGVFVMIANAQKSSSITLQDLKAKEKAILSKMKSVPAKEREYVSYRREQEILQAVYLMLLQKREETILSLSKHAEHARTIDPAYAEKKPLGPRKLYALIGMLVLTLVVPVCFLFSKELYFSLKEEYKRTK